MRRIIKTAIFLLYKHYSSEGTKNIAYESAIITATFFIMIHLLQIKVIFWGGGMTFGDTKLEKFLSVSITFFPVYFALSRLFKKQEIVKFENELSIKERNGYLIMLLYIITSMLFLTFLIFKSKAN
jgi:hypothetical protein